MGFDFLQAVNIVFNLEVEPPGTGDAGLPEVLRFVVLLGVKGRVTDVFEQQQRLLVKGLLDFERSLLVTPLEVREYKILIEVSV